MVLKLCITLQNIVHQNCHFLAFSDCPPNEVPAWNPFYCCEMVKWYFPFCCGEMVKCSFPLCCGEMVKCNLVTTNIPFARFLLAYPPHAAYIPSAPSPLRCPIPSGSVNMSSWMPFLAPCAQHRKDFVSCPFYWWCLWCLHFLVSGKLLGMINLPNIVVDSI